MLKRWMIPPSAYPEQGFLHICGIFRSVWLGRALCANRLVTHITKCQTNDPHTPGSKASQGIPHDWAPNNTHVKLPNLYPPSRTTAPGIGNKEIYLLWSSSYTYTFSASLTSEKFPGAGRWGSTQDIVCRYSANRIHLTCNRQHRLSSL